MSNEVEMIKIDTILLDVAREERKFTTVRDLSAFLEEETSFWRGLFKNFSNQQPMNHLISYLNTANNEIRNYKNSYSNWNENNQKTQLVNCVNRIKENINKIAFSMSPLGVAFAEVCKAGPKQAYGFWVSVTGYNNGNLQDISSQSLEGFILGYEFSHQGECFIYKRRESEKRALSALRKSLSEKTDEIIGHSDEFMRKIDEWKVSSKQDLVNERELYKSKHEEFLEDSSQTLSRQIEGNNENLDNFFNRANKHLDDLEMLYREKLRLEPAATYWNTRASSLKKSGQKWGGLLFLFTASTGVGFAFLFHDWLTSGKIVERLSAMHWQGAILLVATLTMFIYLIRVLGKMTFSSFHLQRDAEERELLSYLYLALSEKGNVDAESRQVVLQALFSRAETGLLSGDHGPTIPAAEVIQKLK